MNQDETLLQAIIDDPDDDMVRLVYADWLDDRGQSERAEFIRVQIELARLPFEDERISELQAREFRLLARHGMTWLNGATSGTFHRGFREEWEFDRPVLFALTGAKLCAHHPVRCIAFGNQDEGGWGKIVAESPHLAGIEAIRLCWHLPHRPLKFQDVFTVLSSPHLTRLTALDLGGGHFFGDDGLFRLLRPGQRTRFLKLPAGPLPSLRNLRRLALHGMGLTDVGVRALVESPLAQTLTHLDLSGNEITQESIRALIDSPLWSRLEALNLGGLYSDSPGGPARLVVEALPQSAIRCLGLASGRFFNEADPLRMVETLASSPWGKVEALDLSWNGLTGTGLTALAKVPQLAGLRWLNLDSNDLDGEDVTGLFTSPFLEGLTALSMYGGMSDAGLQALADSPLRRLVYLNIDASDAVSDVGVSALVRSPAAARLRVVDLPPGAAGDAGMCAIADSPYLGRLTSLLFGGSSGVPSPHGPTDVGALALVRSTNLPNLAHIETDWPRVSEIGARALLECERFAWAGWPDLLGNNKELLQAYRDHFDDFHGTDMLPGDDWRLFPWSKFCCS
jgi:uncharacterized protein (TIGR02996 family)